MDPIDFSSYIKDFAFGFLHKGEPIDMLDNEYIRLRFFFENKLGVGIKEKEDIGMHDCSGKNFVSDIYDPE